MATNRVVFRGERRPLRRPAVRAARSSMTSAVSIGLRGWSIAAETSVAEFRPNYLGASSSMVGRVIGFL